MLQALQPHLQPFGLEARHLEAVIDGCQVDLEQSRFADFACLAAYCELVAGIVGEVAARIFGHSADDDPAVRAQAGPGDAAHQHHPRRRRGRAARAHLPAGGSSCRRYGVTAGEILAREAPWGYSERFEALMRMQAARAHACFDEALALLPEVDRERQLPGLMMANIYRTLLREIEAQGFKVLHQRTSLTPLRKLWIAARTRWRGR
ncbi:hypothetical protein MASR1M6_23550 [Rubrivivax sp.]